MTIFYHPQKASLIRDAAEFLKAIYQTMENKLHEISIIFSILLKY